MGFTAKQVQVLRRNLDHRHIRTREAHGRELSYVEGWYAISEANRIFEFDGWNRETVDSRCVLARENRGTFVALYIARVRVTVHADGATIIREGYGTGEGRGTSPGEVHDIALKAAETDATKRALAIFGKPFGLELYRGGSTASQKPLPSPPVPMPADSRVGFHPDDTTPIPRLSRYYGRRQDLVTRDRAQGRREPEVQPSAGTSIVPASPGLVPTQIDKSVLAIAEPKRLRDKAHLRFVASQPCLICGRQPSDPHHLRFAQPRALGLKVSDEFTVPLCRDHHQQLHHVGNEVAWWHDLDIKALEIAKGLWEESRTKAFPTAAKTPQQQAPRDPSHADPRQEASKLPNESN
ncbi:MAG TPA: Rad52/Rad22 family DNA repair protein [Candidatus Limnocylindrales bacterium]|nr:Rad52/Rad22 family DNA repair protein [Candidatus Limnocylindrales bacterium]